MDSLSTLFYVSMDRQRISNIYLLWETHTFYITNVPTLAAVKHSAQGLYFQQKYMRIIYTM